MSLIPYSPREDDSREIVLRHNQNVVVYDPQSRLLALREATPSANTGLELQYGHSDCPYCHRPLHNGAAGLDDSSSIDGEAEQEGPRIGGIENGIEEPHFVDPSYFRMLQASAALEAPPEPSPLTIEVSSPTQPQRMRLQHARVDDADESPNVSFSSLVRDQKSGEETRSEKISSSSFSHNYFEKFFKVEKELGRGGNGVVLLVKHVLDGVSLGHFACKRVPVGNNHKWLEKVLTEVQLLQQLSHQNLVSYRHVWLQDMVLSNNGPSVPCAFILQQYCNSGDLHTYVLGNSTKITKEMLKERFRRKSRGQPEPPEFLQRHRRLPFEQIISFFRDVASGLNHLHKNGFIHRDLKPSNCLLNDSGIPGSELRVLLSDFGEVQMENQRRNSTGATGTISYCAPETLKRVGPNGEYANFTTKSDVFGLGMILYFMCFNKLPYANADEEHEENEDIEKLREEISQWTGIEVETTKNKELRPDLPDQLFKSLSTLLSPNPDVRPTADEILRQLELGFGSFLGDEVPIVPPSRKFRASSASRNPRSARPSNSVGGTRTGTLDDDPLGFRRISPVADTPPTSSTPMSSHSRNASRVFFNNVNRASPLRQNSSSEDVRTGVTPSPMDRSHSLDSRLVLRPRSSAQSPAYSRSPSPSHSPTRSPNHRSSPLKLQPSPRLPAPPTPNTRLAKVALAVRRPEFVTAVKLAVFLLKAFTVWRPCAPLAPNPWVHFLLLALGVLDFAGWYYRFSVLLLAAHVAVLTAAGGFGKLCSYRY